MCKYCEIEEVGNEAKKAIRKNQRITIKIVTNMFNKNIYYLDVRPERMTGENININYCPFCGRKLGDEDK